MCLHYNGNFVRANRFLGVSSVLVVREDRLDRAVPAAVVERQHVLGERGALGQHLLERRKEDRLVDAVAIEAGAGGKALTGDRDDFAGDVEQRLAAEIGLEAFCRHGIA